MASTDVVVAYLGLAQDWGERSQGTRSCWQQDRQQVAGTIGRMLAVEALLGIG